MNRMTEEPSLCHLADVGGSRLSFGVDTQKFQVSYYVIVG